jgi:hypothetical protein
MPRHAPFILLLVLTGMALGACSGSSQPSEPPVTPPIVSDGTASITGAVVVAGTPPPPETIRLDADPQCVSLAQGEARTSEDMLVGEGGAVQNVFVYVKEGLPARAFDVPREAVVLDQQRCRYVPRVLGVQVGQPLKIRNSDPLLHTVRADARVNARFNVATPLQGMEVTRTLRDREVMLPVKCDMHPWMTSYVGVLDHPFFDVTDESGNLSITGLPSGTYTFEFWHERLGTRSLDVRLSPGETRAITFTFTAQ